MNKKELIQHYEKFKPEIKNRLKEFEAIDKTNKSVLFKELVYCLLTAGTSAELSLKTIEYIGGVIHYGTEEEIIAKLKEIYRFYNIRGNYIFLARDKFKDLDITNENIREQLVDEIKGLGMKEASHFLRNIGFKGYAILDKHIIQCLYELNVLENNKPPKSIKHYLEIEEIMKSFSNKINISMDELDLVLWSWKTGKVLK